MEHVRIDDVDDWMGPADVKRPVGRALGIEHAAINYYELAPGESFAFGYHRHEAQEEVFHLLSGTATFETEEGDIEVSAGELLRVAPGEWQRGTNRGDERVRALAIGAPADAGETRIRRDCPDCGERTDQSIERAEGDDGLVTLCVDCGAETGRFS